MMEPERAISEGGGDGTKRGPDFVSIPDARLNLPPPLKLQVEESAEAMSPRNMWQESGTQKPIVAFIVGLTTPPGHHMGHAGGIFNIL